MKWDAVARGRHEPEYAAPDKLVAFAEDNHLAFHGHTIWWHESVPEIHLAASDRDFAQAALKHLETTIGRYAGRVYSWDVVNEPLSPEQDRTDGLRQSRFLKAFGPDYIGMAYRKAAALDPAAILVLNEMGLEYASAEAEWKRRRMLDFLERELSGGTPITCLGLQSHLTAGEQPREHPQLRTFLRSIEGLGLSVMITEMDVSDHRCPGDRRQRDRMVSDTYRAHLDLVLEESAVLSVSTWGLSDGRTWLNAFHPRADGARQRPLPLDRAYRRKPAWHAIQAALAPTREHKGPSPMQGAMG